MKSLFSLLIIISLLLAGQTAHAFTPSPEAFDAEREEAGGGGSGGHMSAAPLEERPPEEIASHFTPSLLLPEMAEPTSPLPKIALLHHEPAHKHSLNPYSTTEGAESLLRDRFHDLDFLIVATKSPLFSTFRRAFAQEPAELAPAFDLYRALVSETAPWHERAMLQVIYGDYAVVPLKPTAYVPADAPRIYPAWPAAVTTHLRAHFKEEERRPEFHVVGTRRPLPETAKILMVQYPALYQHLKKVESHLRANPDLQLLLDFPATGSKKTLHSRYDCLAGDFDIAAPTTRLPIDLLITNSDGEGKQFGAQFMASHQILPFNTHIRGWKVRQFTPKTVRFYGMDRVLECAHHFMTHHPLLEDAHLSGLYNMRVLQPKFMAHCPRVKADLNHLMSLRTLHHPLLLHMQEPINTSRLFHVNHFWIDHRQFYDLSKPCGGKDPKVLLAMRINQLNARLREAIKAAAAHYASEDGYGPFYRAVGRPVWDTTPGSRSDARAAREARRQAARARARQAAAAEPMAARPTDRPGM